ncbi:Probable RNA-directed DNA polymerase from transposon X-element [Eumeta japonica]|uniref:Probable RNA-directed DNA polymerase from transposon X-element n=1 Tax=Eumeta variegata TaxID=151549 RepID=A0A4C1ZZ22_EUMVA|nr:Probable RNA-directed DNA polymerase from transposon X-element [Eumeta japonica]
MVRARLTSTPTKRKRMFHDDISPSVYIFNGDQLKTILEEPIEKNKGNSVPIPEKYEKFINMLQKETKKVNPRSKSVVSNETKQLLHARKELLQKKGNIINRGKIAEISKIINKNIRKDRKLKRQNTLKKHIEKTGGTKKAIKELNSKKDWLVKVKNKNRNYTNIRPKILKIAAEYYRKLYQSNNLKKEGIDKRNKTDSEPTANILKEETIRAINTQKRDKTPGSDQITNELLKATLLIIVPTLTEIFNEILETENIPTDWTKSTIILLHKKGDKGEIANYRPISLMSNLYKVFSKIILSRITSTLDENQPKEQAGFRSKYSTVDHIHVLRQIVQKYNEYKKYYLGFVYNKAFDSLEHDYIWEALCSCKGAGKIHTYTDEYILKSTAKSDWKQRIVVNCVMRFVFVFESSSTTCRPTPDESHDRSTDRSGSLTTLGGRRNHEAGLGGDLTNCPGQTLKN